MPKCIDKEGMKKGVGLESSSGSQNQPSLPELLTLAMSTGLWGQEGTQGGEGRGRSRDRVQRWGPSKLRPVVRARSQVSTRQLPVRPDNALEFAAGEVGRGFWE